MTLLLVCAVFCSRIFFKTVLHTSAAVIFTAPTDYQTISETLTFDRQTNRTCRNITIEDDAIEEPSEFFNVTLTTDDISVILDPRIATVMIIDDDVG